jgi:hypothetical protein
VVIVEVAVQEGQELGLGLGCEDEAADEVAVTDGVEGGFGLSLFCDGAVGLGPVGPGGSALGIGSGFRDANNLSGMYVSLPPTYTTVHNFEADLARKL